MQIRTKLTLLFTGIVMTILAVFSIWIYVFSLGNQRDEFYKRLKDEALTTATLFSRDVAGIDTTILKIVDKNNLAFLPDERVIIYNEEGHEVYRNPQGEKGKDLSIEDKASIKGNTEIFYKEYKNQFAQLYYDGKMEKLFVIASAYDQLGEKNLQFLAEILIIGFLLAGILTGVTGYYYARQALLPISKVVNKVEHITASNLDLRVDAGNGTDEIAQLSLTFNQMLNRLEDAFEMQKNFVSNASHELRTPLTAITGQIEVSLINDRQPEEYRQVLSSILEDMKDYNQLVNGLLELTQANTMVGGITLQPIRIDELLWQARNDLVKRNSGYTAGFTIPNFPEEEKELVVNGNQLLKTALLNIMDNACKFSSDHHVQISLYNINKFIHLSFTDHGVGISQSDIKKIFRPFHRAANAKEFAGHGLGLSLTKKIIEQHKGDIIIDTEENKYTTITVILPVIGE